MSIQFKRISHHNTKFAEVFVKEHHTLYQTCGKLNLFISIRNLFSTKSIIFKNKKKCEKVI